MGRRAVLGVAAALAVSLAVPSAAQAGPPAHVDPTTMPVPFDGEPWYIESTPSPDGSSRNGVVGSPVSDYGSHFGVKANLWQHRPLYLANYAAVPGISGKLDRSAFDVLDADGQAIPLQRSVDFEPWGWRERAEGDGVTVSGAVSTVDTDAFLLGLTVAAKEPVRVRLRVSADENSNAVNEGNIPVQLPGAADAKFDAARNELVVSRFGCDQTISGGLTSLTKCHRVYRLSGFPVESTSFTPGPSTYSFDLLSKPITGTHNITTTLGVGASEDAARARADAGSARVGSGTAEALRSVEKDWAEFFAEIPQLPGGASADERRLYRMANTALRMNLVAPRARMTGWGSVPSKVHFNLFFGWDTPLQAIGYAEWGGWTPEWLDQSEYTAAEQMLLDQLDAALPTGQVCIAHDDSKVCPLPGTHPPVQGWAAWEVARRDPDKARAGRFLTAAYDRLQRYHDFWFTFYDADFDKLPEYRVGLEYGWDDTPRYSGRDHEQAESFLPANVIEPVDLASWLAMYEGSMGRIADRLGRPAQAEQWRSKARAMAGRIESQLWKPARGAWLDKPMFLPIQEVRTPAMWWPVFAGAYTESGHAAEVVERHLLDPQAFFGQYPIPSVAYDDPLYDAEQGGYYWQGQIWLVPTYASLVALERTGHHAEADVLLERTVDMMARNGVVFENYDALTGEVGWGATGGPGVEPAAFQFGWSSALINQALLGRHADVPAAIR